MLKGGMEGLREVPVENAAAGAAAESSVEEGVKVVAVESLVEEAVEEAKEGCPVEAQAAEEDLAASRLQERKRRGSLQAC